MERRVISHKEVIQKRIALTDRRIHYVSPVIPRTIINFQEEKAKREHAGKMKRNQHIAAGGILGSAIAGGVLFLSQLVHDITVPTYHPRADIPLPVPVPLTVDKNVTMKYLQDVGQNQMGK